LIKEDARAYESLPEKLYLLTLVSKYGLGNTFVADNQNRLLGLSLVQIRNAIEKYLMEDDMTYLVVGDGATQLSSVESFAGENLKLLDKMGNPIVERK
jgi:zinc protease